MNSGTTEIAGLKTARPVAMKRQWYQCCKTEMDVVVRCRKHTKTGNILYAVINSCRKKHVTDTERVKKPTQNQNASKVSKNTSFCENCKRNVFYITLSYRRTLN